MLAIVLELCSEQGEISEVQVLSRRSILTRDGVLNIGQRAMSRILFPWSLQLGVPSSSELLDARNIEDSVVQQGGELW